MRKDLLVRAADQGPTYLTWRWLQTPEDVHFAVLDTGALDTALDRLAHALPHPLDDESDTDAVHRALVTGPFADPDRERDLATELTAAVLPDELATTLTDTAQGQGCSIRLRLIPSPRLARVPWELLVLPDGRRLLEIADITLDPPATLYAGRGRDPIPWADVADQPVLYLLDPAVTAGPHLGRVLDPAGRSHLETWLDEKQAANRVLSEDRFYALRGTPNRHWLSKRLCDGAPSRLLYYGHASSSSEEIGSAAIHLADSRDTYGLADSIGEHRPLTALDLLVGTLTADADRPSGSLPSSRAGHDIWPMPPRVAIIACESGSDYRLAEPFGLVLACLNAGAEFVTATRWALPTDHVVNTYTDHSVAPGNTTALMQKVDQCHQCDDPVGELGAWQRGKLTAWIDHGELSDTPLLWVALTTHLAPTRSLDSP